MPAEVDAEMLAFHHFCAEVCGVFFKVIKDRVAAQVQLALGFVWDSTTLTRELEEGKLLSYLDMLADASTSDTLTLREMQSIAGRMQRCIMTFPPGAAWMLVPLFALMAGLRLPHHRRRVTREVKDNFSFCSRMLSAAMGRGFYSLAGFGRAPSVWTDASKSKRYTGGGFVSEDGTYDFWKYGSRAARRPIDELEGDTVVVACMRMAHRWSGCIVTIFCDNSAFQKSGAKGRSKAERLNNLVKELFLLMCKYAFVLDLQWISTHDNVNADHLSREGREEEFLKSVHETECLAADATLLRMEGAGRTRVLPEKRGVLEVAHESDRECADFTRRAVAAPGPTRFAKSLLVLSIIGCFCVQSGDAMPLSRFDAALSYPTTSLFEGLPADLLPAVEGVINNRLSSSSWSKVRTGMRLWRQVADSRGWAHVIRTGDQHRGAKLVTFVMHLVENTELVWHSIEIYTWAVRSFMQSQHELDPVLGVHHWSSFMDGVKVLTIVPAEPRRATPMDVLDKLLDAINLNSFEEVQLALLILVCLYSFTRTECPCPKTFEGRDSYDKDVHFNVFDFDIAHVAGRRVLKVRFRVIKQDQRVERPEARGDGDWVYLGEVRKDGEPSKWCPVAWFLRLQRFHGPRADKRGPMFLDPDGRRPLIYRKFGAQFKALQRRVGVRDVDLTMPHGLRVRGYNNTKSGLGQDIAVAQGGWKSSAHSRYDRFAMSQVVRIPSVIAGVDDGDDSAPTNEAEERAAGPPTRRLRRDSLRSLVSQAYDDDGDDDDDDDEEEAEPEAEVAGSDDAESVRSGEAASPLVHLTPAGAMAQPGGFWGQGSTRLGPRARSPTSHSRARRSPSSS